MRDLVVLLCLAALALPVLAGALGSAVQLSAAERCRANLASLLRCIQVYTAQNRGYLPVYQHLLTRGYVRAPDNTYKSTVAFTDVNGVNPATGLLADVRGLGLPYAQGLIRPPELLYCPGPMPDVRHTLANYPKPWGSAVGPGSGFIRTGYMWNPWVKPIPGGSANQWTYDDALALSRHPRERFLICDLVYEPSVMSHPLPGSAQWNVALPDGRVGSFQNAALYEMLTISHLDCSQTWDLFNQYVRPLLPGANP
jgi:type II secretory pathway pseudopilin PulG